jgi:hypothetical protein
MANNGKYGRQFEYKYSHFGQDTYGHDIKAFGDTTGKYFLWDASANTFTIVGTLTLDGTFNADNIALIDAETLTFGTGSDVTIQWDGTNMIIAAATDDSLIEIGDSAATQKSFDLKWYANEANGASYLYADASENLIYTTGVDLQFKDSDYLVFGTGAGATGDVGITWDGTNLIVSAVADDTLIEIGDSAATQLSFDLKWYANENNGASYLYCDASENLIYTTGVDLQFKDSDVLVFGTGAGATGDVGITWDGTNLIISATADDTLIEIGDSAATQLSFDLKWYGDDANGAKYLYFDASENMIYTTGVDFKFKDNDYCLFGSGGDVTITWDTAKLVVNAQADDTLIQIGKSAATQKSFDLQWFAEAANGANYLYADASRNLIETTNIEISTRKRVDVFDDFFQQTIAETDTPWILNSGTDPQALDPAIDTQEGGVIKLTSGDASGAVAADGSQIVCSIPMQADSGGLVFETRLHLNTAITGISCNAGFTDTTALEEPFTNAADVITAVANDAVCFVFDDGATTKEWFAAAVDSTTQDAGNAASGDAPVADTYQTLRIEVSADGATINFYVDGTLTHTLSGDEGVSPDVNLYATVVICSTTTASVTADIDYLYCGHNR